MFIDLFSDLLEDGVSVLSADEDDVLIDPAFRQEYMAWKKDPTLDRISPQEKQNPFLDRLYREDIDPCLDFPCEDRRLVEAVQRGIHEQTVCIAPLRNDELAQGCPLLNHDRYALNRVFFRFSRPNVICCVYF